MLERQWFPFTCILLKSSGNVFNIDVTSLPSPTHTLRHFLFSSVRRLYNREGEDARNALQFFPYQSTAGAFDAESSHGNAVFIILNQRRKNQIYYGNPLKRDLSAFFGAGGVCLKFFAKSSSARRLE